jgi:hypothetical protein
MRPNESYQALIAARETGTATGLQVLQEFLEGLPDPDLYTLHQREIDQWALDPFQEDRLSPVEGLIQPPQGTHYYQVLRAYQDALAYYGTVETLQYLRQHAHWILRQRGSVPEETT